MTIDDSTPRRRWPRKRLVALALLLVGTVALSTASAATLRITATGHDNVAAGSADVTAVCSDTVTSQISGYTWDGNSFSATSVDVTGISDCEGKSIYVQVLSEAGVLATGVLENATGDSTQSVVLTPFLTAPEGATASIDPSTVHVVIS